MEITEVKISDLNHAEYNPRRLTKSQYDYLKTSLEKFGFCDPVIVNSNPERKNIIIGGHQRVRVWSRMKKKTVPVVYIDLPIDKEKELNIRLNKNTGEWDFDKLANEFDLDKLIQWGFDEKEFEIDPLNDEEEGEKVTPEKQPIICPECGHEF